MKKIKQIGINSKKALVEINQINSKKINKVLLTFNQLLSENKKIITKENLKDIKNVKRKNLVDRLILNEKRIDNIRESVSQIIKFKDPLNRVLEKWTRPNGLQIKKVSTVPNWGNF